MKELEAGGLLSNLTGIKTTLSDSLDIPIVGMNCLLKTKKELKKCKETRDSRYIYQSKLDKTCFMHNMAHGYLKYFPRKMAYDNVLRDRAFNFVSYPKYN